VNSKFIQRLYKLEPDYFFMIGEIFRFVMHFDQYLELMIGKLGLFVYFVLFAIIFCETGFVFTPFLPGDSLLFVAGTFAGSGILNIFVLFAIFSLASILGDTVNYWIGSFFGERVFAKSRFFKQEYMEKTKNFYNKYGAKTIVLARFVPIIRTFAPFVAGIGKMYYGKFLFYNVIGGLAWVSLFLFSGYFFGKIPIIENNLTLVVLLIVVISVIPGVVEFLRERRRAKRETRGTAF
jgi:membrane-associated protein